MSNRVAEIEVKRSRGKIQVIALGRSDKGRKYIKAQLPIAAKTPADPKYKEEIKTAVEQLTS